MNFSGTRSSLFFTNTQDVFDFYGKERNRTNSLKKGSRLSTMSLGLDGVDQQEYADRSETLSDKGFRFSQRFHLHFPSRKKKKQRSNSININPANIEDEVLRLDGVLCYLGKSNGICGHLIVNSKKIVFTPALAEQTMPLKRTPVITTARLRRPAADPLQSDYSEHWEIDFFNLGEVGREISGDYHVIYINCRNFRQVKIGLQQVPADRLYDRLNRIGVEAMTSGKKRCFLWEYLHDTYQYRVRADWHKHEPWYINNFKIQFSQFNEIGACVTLPEIVIVPRRVSDQELNAIAAISEGQRVPVVTYLHRDSGHMIVRSTTIPRNSLRQAYRAFNDLRIPLDEYHVGAILAPVEEIEKCYFKLRRACLKAVKMNRDSVIGSAYNIDHSKQFWPKCSHWLYWLSRLLHHTAQMAKVIQTRATVGLVEPYDCNWNCCLSSLLQLWLDPSRRTISGFESLLSKEWVHLSGYRREFGAEPSFRKPNSIMFLLFLDAVHQLMVQNERHFEFSAFYLVLLVDVELSSEMFSCQSKRSQFDIDKTHPLIYNPLFEEKCGSPLKAKTHVTHLRLFTKLFFRSMPWQLDLQRFTVVELMIIQQHQQKRQQQFATDDDHHNHNHQYHDENDDPNSKF